MTIHYKSFKLYSDLKGALKYEDFYWESVFILYLAEIKYFQQLTQADNTDFESELRHRQYNRFEFSQYII